MTPERWRQIKTVFQAVLELNDEHERHERLIALCGADAEIRAEVESLLDAHASVRRQSQDETRSRDDGAWPLGSPGAPRKRTSREDAPFAGNARFAIEAHLGSGGFGTVYRAHDRRTDARVALKVLDVSDPESLLRFKREFRMSADLEHPNLVRLHELFVEDGHIFFTMELVEGKPLVEAIRDGHAVEAVFAQLAAGLSALHRQGILHRDLKPSNVLVTPAGRVAILDFGLATEARPGGSQTSHLVGTPSYMAPEQFARERATQASDWYSVGVMLYEALSGQLPFSGNLLALVAAKAGGQLPAPSSLRTGVPARLDALCMALLHVDPALRPNGQEVEHILGAGAAPEMTRETRPHRGVGPAPGDLTGGDTFVGRNTELTTVERAFARSAAGELAVLVVRGPSGIGKTALVKHFLDGEARARGSAVLVSRCHEREALGYKVFDGIVDELSQLLRRLPEAQAQSLLPRHVHELARLFPVLMQVPAVANARRRVFDGVDSLEQQRNAFEALRELLDRLSHQHPVILFVDDLQWGDKDSAALLRAVVRGPSPPPLLLVAACRDDDSVAPAFETLLAAVRSGPHHEELTLNALDPGDARELAARMLGPDHPALEAVAEESGGVPFFVDALAERFSTSADGAVSRGVRLATVLLERIAKLSPGARRMLNVVCVSGKPVRRRVLEQAAELSGVEAQQAEEVLKARRLCRVTADGESLEPYHDRIRDAVAEAFPPDQLPALHGRLAEALERSGSADAEDLAHLLRSAGHRDRAAENAARAADRWMDKLAFHRAASLYRLAVDLRGPADGTDPVTSALVLKLAEALASAGSGSEAATAYFAAAKAMPARRLELTVQGAQQMLRAGDIAGGRALMSDLLRSLGWRIPRTRVGLLVGTVWARLRVLMRGLRTRERPASAVPPERLLLLDAGWALAGVVSMVDIFAGVHFQAWHLIYALGEGEPLRLARAFGVEAAHRALPGRRSARRSERVMALVWELARKHADPIIAAYAELGSAMIAWLHGRWQDAYTHGIAAEGAFKAAGRGLSWEVSTARLFAFSPIVFMGRIRDYALRAPELIEEARLKADFYGETGYAIMQCTHVMHLAHDEPRQALSMVDGAMSRWPGQGFQLQHIWAVYARAEIALYEGDAERAWRIVEESWPNALRSSLFIIKAVQLHMRFLRARAALALARVDAHRRRALLAIAGREARLIERRGDVWSAGFARVARAGIAALSGDRSGARALLTTAREELKAADMMLYAHAAQSAVGLLTDGAPGHVLRNEAEAAMSAEGVVHPHRITATLIPFVVS